MKPAVAFDPEFDAPAKGREKGRPKRPWLVESLIVICVLCPFGLVVWLPILTDPNFGKPLGRVMPDEPPDEANRVVNPAGFSIILPPHWESRNQGASPYGRISAVPRMLLSKPRSPSILGVTRWPQWQPHAREEYRQTVFQGRPALEQLETRRGTFDDPPRFRCTLAFQRVNAWYELTYSVAQDRESVPPIMMRYFNTFRHESPPEAISPDTALLHKGPGTKDQGQRTTDK